MERPRLKGNPQNHPVMVGACRKSRAARSRAEGGEGGGVGRGAKKLRGGPGVERRGEGRVGRPEVRPYPKNKFGGRLGVERGGEGGEGEGLERGGGLVEP